MVGDAWRAETWRGRVGYLLNPPGWSEKTTPTARPGRHVLEAVG